MILKALTMQTLYAIDNSTPGIGESTPPRYCTGVVPKVFLLDDNSDALLELERRLTQSDKLNIVGASLKSLDRQIINKNMADVFLVRANRNDPRACQFVARLCCLVSERPVVAVTDACDSATVMRLFMQGATGCVVSPISLPECEKVLFLALSHSMAACNQAMGAVLSGLRTVGATTAAGQGLSRRKREILQLLFLGFSNKDIAVQLNLGLATVHTHLTRMFKSLGARSRGEALDKYLKLLKEPDSCAMRNSAS